jgi:hypothetical protein
MKLVVVFAFDDAVEISLRTQGPEAGIVKSPYHDGNDAGSLGSTVSRWAMVRSMAQDPAREVQGLHGDSLVSDGDVEALAVAPSNKQNFST